MSGSKGLEGWSVVGPDGASSVSRGVISRGLGGSNRDKCMGTVAVTELGGEIGRGSGLGNLPKRHLRHPQSHRAACLTSTNLKMSRSHKILRKSLTEKYQLSLCRCQRQMVRMALFPLPNHLRRMRSKEC